MVLKGVLNLLSAPGPDAGLSVLIFHRVHAQQDPLFPGEVDAGQFDAICRWVKEWFSVLPLEVAVARMKAGSLPARALAITFDDGYADNHDVALPILERHGLTATFFVATGFLDGGRMWNDTVIEAIRRTRLQNVDLAGTAAAAIGALDCSSLETRRSAISRVIGQTKYLVPAERDHWVAAIRERCQAALPGDLMMRSEQVHALRQRGMGIGAHTATHPILAKLSEHEIRREIVLGRDALQAITGAPVSLFAYPNGKPGEDYGEAATRVVQDLGFDAAFSTTWGVARRSADPFQLPRFSPWDRSRLRFGLRMCQNLWRHRQ